MAGKAVRSGRITGHGTSAWASGKPIVVLNGEITDAADAGRPVQLGMTPAEARKWAAGLIRMAEYLESRADGSEAEQAPEQAPQLTGGLASLLGVAGKPAVDFTEVRPGVWKTATPEDAERLDDSIDAALANLGTSLAELREGAEPEQQTEHVSCPRCKRDVPVKRTMEKDGARVCSPIHDGNYSECQRLWLTL